MTARSDSREQQDRETADFPRQADERVLSTLNRDGSRRWLRPRSSPGRFLSRRRIFGYCLMLLFTITPYTKIGGKPTILLDIPAREFTFFGTTFLPTDTLPLALGILSTFIAIFLMTALFGRVWCGWGCPQTVYMELLYRPIERLFEGRRYRKNGRAEIEPLRTAGKYAVFLILSMFLAHTFLAYFVGVERLARWVRQSPFEHPTAFMVMAGTTALMMLDFSYMREQVCTLMCPYGRFQSVLLDRKSLIISYDEARGEPRGKLRRARHDGSTPDKSSPEARRGDCVDCGLCVTTCPTGIDIRDGLQMECIGCAQCIDACDAVMEKVGRDSGLIRYSSQFAMETGRTSLLRPRVVIYPLLLATVVTLFSVTLAGRAAADISLLRTRNATYSLTGNGSVENIVEIKVTNRTSERRDYSMELLDEEAFMTSAHLPMSLATGASGSATLRVTVPRERFERGRASLLLRVQDDLSFDSTFDINVLGPLFSGDAPESSDP